MMHVGDVQHLSDVGTDLLAMVGTGRERGTVPILGARGISKRYGAVDALRAVDLELFSGELVAMVGDNGAGKSTLAKILAGVIQPDAGHITMDGRPVTFRGPDDALGRGIHAVYQDLAIVPTLDVTGNVFLGRELTTGWGPFRILDSKQMRRQAEQFFARLQVDVPSVSGRIVGSMSGGQRQAIAIARSAFVTSTLLIMDEPTAALGIREARAALSLIHLLRNSGAAILLITHALPHIADLADRVVVLRHGEKVADFRGDIDLEHVVSLIVGSQVDAPSD